MKDKQLQIKFASTDSNGLMGVHGGMIGATGVDVASIPTDNVYVKGLPLDIDEGIFAREVWRVWEDCELSRDCDDGVDTI